MIAKFKNIVKYSLMLLLPILFWFLLDFFYGKTTHIDYKRKDALMFRNEMSKFYTRTNRLLPNLAHQYQQPFRLEGDAHFERQKDRIFRTNSEGFPIGPNQREGGKYIAFLGGSTTECNEVDDVFRFPSLVGTYIENKLPFSTVNAGVRGHTTIDSINRLNNDETIRNASYVVMMHNINDRLLLASECTYFTPQNQIQPLSLDSVVESLEVFLSKTIEVLSYHSNILFMIREHFFHYQMFLGDKDFGGIHTSKAICPLNERLKLFKQNLKIFTSTSSALGIVPILMTQPLGFESEEHMAFNKSIRDVSEQNNVLLIDLEKYIPPVAKWAFLPDDIHYSNDGSRYIAFLVAEALGRYINAKNLKSSGDCYISTPFKYTRYPAFNSSGSLISFQYEENGYEKIGVYSLKTNNIIDTIDLSSQFKNVRHPVFFYKNNDEYLLFGMQDRDGDPKDETLNIYNIKNKFITSLASGKPIYGSIPSRDEGGYVYYACPREEDVHLCAFDIVNENVIFLTKGNTEHWRPAPGFGSSDLFYIKHSAKGFDIFRLDINTKKEDVIYQSEVDEWDPAISFDNRFLVFSSKIDGKWTLLGLDTTSSKVSILRKNQYDNFDATFYPQSHLLFYAESTKDGSCLQSLDLDKEFIN